MRPRRSLPADQVQVISPLRVLVLKVLQRHLASPVLTRTWDVGSHKQERALSVRPLALIKSDRTTVYFTVDIIADFHCLGGSLIHNIFPKTTSAITAQSPQFASGDPISSKCEDGPPRIWIRSQLEDDIRRDCTLLDVPLGAAGACSPWIAFYEISECHLDRLFGPIMVCRRDGAWHSKVSNWSHHNDGDQ